MASGSDRRERSESPQGASPSRSSGGARGGRLGRRGAGGDDRLRRSRRTRGATAAPACRSTVQYNGQGATFNDLSAFDYSKPTAIPGFAHSGTVAVEPCAGVEFCTAPARADFTTPQRTVGAWVGFSGPLVEPLGVRLTAFDAASGVVGTDDATLPANASPTPIQTHLEVDAPPARIVGSRSR